VRGSDPQGYTCQGIAIGLVLVAGMAALVALVVMAWWEIAR